MIGQVVAGIDGSENSLAAFQSGLDLCARAKAELKLVFVVDSRKTDLPIIYTASHFDYGFERVYVPPEPGLTGFYERVKRDLQTFGENVIERCRTEAGARGVTVTPVVREGLPSAVLTEESRSGDLLVLGQKGENAHYDRAIVGSTTEDVMRSSPRPTLVCPRRFASPARVLCPYDGSQGAENALRFYVNAMHGLFAELVVLTVNEELAEGFPFDAELSYLATHGVACRLVAEAGPPVDVIPRVAERERADLILVGSHGRHKIREYLLGSTAAHLIRRSSLPVLVVF
jgi:nucleotide-binding universal stress UspA family protein